MIFGVRYWRGLFWINMILAFVHAFNGHNLVFLALGMALLSKFMIRLLENSTEN